MPRRPLVYDAVRKECEALFTIAICEEYEAIAAAEREHQEPSAAPAEDHED